MGGVASRRPGERETHSLLISPPRLSLPRRPFGALEIIEGRDHGAEGLFRNGRIEVLRRSVGADLSDDGVDPLWVADGGGVLLEPPRFAYVLLPLGHQADEVAVDAVDVFAHLAEARAAFPPVCRRAAPGGRPRRRVVGKRRQRGEEEQGEDDLAKHGAVTWIRHERLRLPDSLSADLLLPNRRRGRARLGHSEPQRLTAGRLRAPQWRR